MKRSYLIALGAVPAVLAPSSVFAAEKTISIGPVVEFGGNGTSFGINSKYSVSPEISLRPMLLFGYKPINRSDVNQELIKNGNTQAAIDTPQGQAVISNTIDSIGTGIGYGLSITYDFKSPSSKIVGYVGPRILFGSASKTDSGVTVNSNETSIGLTAGADYAISENVTAGVNATYNFSRNATVNISGPGGSASFSGSNSTFNFGLNVGFSF